MAEALVERTVDCIAGPEVAKLGLTPKGWPPDPMIVRAVDEGTWAASSGFQPGDELVQINGRNVQELDKDVIIQLMKERPVTIRFSREVPSFTAGEDDVRLGMQPGNWPPGPVHIRHVEKESWADERGIEVGSIIVAVNNRTVEDMDMAEFRTLLRSRPLTLSIGKPGEFQPEQSPSVMDRSLRFSVLSPESPFLPQMQSPPSSLEKQKADSVDPPATKAAKMESVKEGWLAKRGPTISYKWLSRWCVMCEDSLTFYAGGDLKLKKGDICIKPGSKIIAFDEPTAPGDSLKHRVARPFGFAFDVDPRAGRNRRLYYFDAGDAEALASWMSALRDATAGLALSLGKANACLRKSLYKKAIREG